ncbi:3-hydroxyacyl-CoA dehydrogenase NAD-binding domain-containing protein [Streptomyces tubercidicus]|uniref:3-hydroxyacyl-CoA dehydrogenase NAD-binding domain-containing protein n=1 Tax=Streptomyces tubercidicus TaxID=47759 RepID=UPI0034663B04
MTSSNIRSAVVVGLGAAGTALARRLADAGIATTGVETDREATGRARRTLGDGLAGVTADLAAAASADIVLEAVPEPEPVKREVLAALAGHVRDGVAVVTTALTTPVAELAAVGPRELLALRFVRADRLDAAELARGPHTTDTATGAVTELLARIGITAHVVPDRPGSLAPALLYGLLNQAAWMHHDGYADRDSIDTAIRLGCGWQEGPLCVLDAIGQRTARDILDGLHHRLGDRFAPAPPVPPAGAAPREAGATSAGGAVETVAVIGSGTMATGIAEVSLRAGFRTVLVARSEEKAADVRESVEFGLLRTGAEPGQVAESLARWTDTTDLAAVADADLVVEAVVENLEVKRELFARLGALCRPGAVLATTTSSLPVGECAEASGRPADVVGLHFFNPVTSMELVEVVRVEQTSDATLTRARAVLNRLGKTGVECGDRTGFIVNALLFPYLNDALDLLDGPDLETTLLDTVVKSVGGQPLGPTRLLDVVGADVALEVQQALYRSSGRPDLAPADLLRRLVHNGFLGRKSAGRGLRAYLTQSAPVGAA